MRFERGVVEGERSTQVVKTRECVGEMDWWVCECGAAGQKIRNKNRMEAG